MIFELACAVIVAMCAAVTVWCAVDTRRHRKRAEAAEMRAQAARERIGGQSGQWAQVAPMGRVVVDGRLKLRAGRDRHRPSGS